MDVSRQVGVSPLEPLGVVLYGRAAYVRAHAHRFSFQTVGFFDGRSHVASPAHPSDSLRGVLFHEYTTTMEDRETGEVYLVFASRGKSVSESAQAVPPENGAD